MGILKMVLLRLIGVEECRHDDESIDWILNEAELCSEGVVESIGQTQTKEAMSAEVLIRMIKYHYVIMSM